MQCTAIERKLSPIVKRNRQNQKPTFFGNPTDRPFLEGVLDGIDPKIVFSSSKRIDLTGMFGNRIQIRLCPTNDNNYRLLSVAVSSPRRNEKYRIKYNNEKQQSLYSLFCALCRL